MRSSGSGRLDAQELSQRTRAFLFCACATALASAYEVSDVDVFENGVGSINFPVMTSMLYGGLSTRGAHPTYLKQMSLLASMVLGAEIRFGLPFADKTKGEMMETLDLPKLTDLLNRTRSCVHTSWRVANESHCGVCPACIERRQAFATARISENVDAYSIDIFREPPKRDLDQIYFRPYREEAVAWLNADSRLHRRMDAHLSYSRIPLNERGRLLGIQDRHSREVKAVYGQ